MVTGVQDIYYSVTDTAKAKRFYTEVLGMALLFEHEHWIALDCHGVRVGLHPEDKPINRGDTCWSSKIPTATSSN